jgi:hypothetical protein
MMLNGLNGGIDCNGCKQRTDHLLAYSIPVARDGDGVARGVVRDAPPFLTLCLKRFTQHLSTVQAAGYVKRKPKKQSKRRKNRAIGLSPQKTVLTSTKNSRQITLPLVLRLAPFCTTLGADAEGVLQSVAGLGAPTATAAAAAPAAEGEGVVTEAPTLPSPAEELVYVLRGVVEHAGTIRGGHYVAYVQRTPPPPRPARGAEAADNDAADADSRSGDADSNSDKADCNDADADAVEDADAAAPRARDALPALVDGRGDLEARIAEARRGEWFYASDTSVRRVQEKDVLAAQAYVVFYERVR